jgi:hypothetical protein
MLIAPLSAGLSTALGIVLGMTDDDRVHKVRENRLRRMAYRQGFTFEKVRRIDRRAIDHGLIRLGRDGVLQYESANLDDIEKFLTSRPA